MSEQALEAIADAIIEQFSSQCILDDNLAPANVVDVMSRMSEQTWKLATAITPLDAISGTDATGGHVRSLTEAIMGMTAALVQIADAIRMVSISIDDLK